MNCLRFLVVTLGLVFLAFGCGNRDTGKNDQRLPVKPDPEKQQPKKDNDNKHSHEPG
jgi:hypothetical protein